MYIILIPEYTIWLRIESLQFQKGRKKLHIWKKNIMGEYTKVICTHQINKLKKIIINK